MIICARCGHSNPDENNFCEQCGIELLNIGFSINSINDFWGFRTDRKLSKKQTTDINAYKVCPKCRGAGSINVQTQTLFGAAMATKTCPQCEGMGLITKESEKTQNNKGQSI